MSLGLKFGNQKTQPLLIYRRSMIDIQSQKDSRNIDIKKVGVKNIKYPIIVLDRTRGTQPVNATINMYVNLPHHFKGTHMSRFVEVLNEFKGQISIKTFQTILEKMRQKLHAHSAYMEIEFPYFLEKTAPVSKAKSLMEYRCFFSVKNNADQTDFLVGIVVPVTTVCPCSREISKFGAHNQRSMVTLKVRFKKFFWIEDIIKTVEESASGEVYSLLKRIDEKYVTEKAYENPKFVEDVVRSIAVKLNKDDNFTWYCIEAENFESIHNHSAYACVEKG
jgi:GTP cyclohydrolase IB